MAGFPKFFKASSKRDGTAKPPPSPGGNVTDAEFCQASEPSPTENSHETKPPSVTNDSEIQGSQDQHQYPTGIKLVLILFSLMTSTFLIALV